MFKCGSFTYIYPKKGMYISWPIFFKPKTRQTYICILNILLLTYCFKLILDKDYIENDINKSDLVEILGLKKRKSER